MLDADSCEESGLEKGSPSNGSQNQIENILFLQSLKGKSKEMKYVVGNLILFFD